jgi:hypothetical protein
MYEGATPTKFGRNHVLPRLEAERTFFHHDEPLEEVENQIPIPVLDQEDLNAQGINVSVLVPGAQQVDALGSCTAQATTAHIAQLAVSAGKALSDVTLRTPGGKSFTLSASSQTNEEFAIVFYHLDTMQTGDIGSEWPPTDCGSTGQDCCAMAIKLGLVKNYIAPNTIKGALLALQTGTVIQGAPWFNSWMSPDSSGFVDGDGSVEALEAAIDSGVAGGHETCQYGIQQLGQTKAGVVDLQKTVIKVRNSWSTQFGLNGDYLLHASTLDLLNQYVDYKQMVV